jgi:hypothetical protein
MIKLLRIQDLLNSSTDRSIVLAAGNKPFLDRPIGRTMAGAVKIGAISLLLAMTSAQGAGASEALFNASAAATHKNSVQKNSVNEIDAEGGGQSNYPGGEIEAHHARFAEYWQRGLGKKLIISNKFAWIARGGASSGEKLIDLWKMGGVTPKQAEALVDVLNITQGPVITRTKGADGAAGELAQRTHAVFAVRSKKDAMKFLKQNSIIALINDGHLNAGFSLTSDVEDNEKTDWESVLFRWLSYGKQRENQNFNSVTVTTKELEVAKQKLLDATDEAGLSSLRVPITMWENPADLELLAVNLKEANHELQGITGWSGGVLGLNGRVDLQIGTAGENSFAALAGGGRITIHTTFLGIGHEFIHALDYALGADAPTPGAFGGLFTTQVNTNGPKLGGSNEEIRRQWASLQKTLWQPKIENTTREHEAGLIKSRSGAYADISEVGADAAASLAMTESPWLAAVSERSKELSSSEDIRDEWAGGYILAPHEIIGFSFGAYASAVVKADGVIRDAASSNGLTGPTMLEAKASAAQWQATFTLIGARWWTRQIAMNNDHKIKDNNQSTEGMANDQPEKTANHNAISSMLTKKGIAEKIFTERNNKSRNAGWLGGGMDGAEPFKTRRRGWH